MRPLQRVMNALTCMGLMACNPPEAAKSPPEESGKGSTKLSRLLAAEARQPGSELELRIAQIYGPSPASIGPGGLPHGSIGPDGVPVDYGLSMQWLRRAASHCYDGGATQAQSQIGDFYAYGAGVKADQVQALAWYLIATRLGASGMGGENVAEARSATSEPQQRIAEQKARDYLAEKERRCGPA
jgi:TPR repeat protein